MFVNSFKKSFLYNIYYVAFVENPEKNFLYEDQ